MKTIIQSGALKPERTFMTRGMNMIMLKTNY